jgi:predicted molibdopterin-dependent oxidoreductase YjgC
MGPHSHHTTQEGDAFCLLEMNGRWCEKCESIQETTAKYIVKMLEETGKKVSISTVKQVLYRHNLKGRSARKKPMLHNFHKKWHNGSSKWTMTPSILPKLWQNGLRTTKSRFGVAITKP